MKKYAVVVGHAQDSQGAVSPFGIGSEWEYNSKVATYLSDVMDVYFHDHYRNGYSKMIDRTSSHINQHNYKLVLILHYNSFANQPANGTEVLHWHNNKNSAELAKNLSKFISDRFKTTNRGNKPTNLSGRGGYELYKLKAPALLIEPFFGSSKSDVSKFKGKEKEYAQTLKDFLKIF